MMNEKNRIDRTYMGIRGRVIMLALLFVFNAMVVIGASLHYTFGMNRIVMILGIIGTVASIAILSTPAQISQDSKSMSKSEEAAFSSDSN